MRISSFAVDLPADWYGRDSAVPDELRPVLEEAWELDGLAGTDSLLTAFWVTAPGMLRGQLQVFDAEVHGVSPRKLVRITRRSPVDGVLLERDVREIAVPVGPAVVDARLVGEPDGLVTFTIDVTVLPPSSESALILSVSTPDPHLADPLADHAYALAAGLTIEQDER